MKPTLIAYASTVPLLVVSASCSSTTDGDGSKPPAESPAESAKPVGVGTVPVVTASAPSPTASASTGAADQAAVLARLDSATVESKAVGRRVLLSWTTRKQAEEIVAGQPILTRIESSTYGPAGFDWAIDGRVARGERLARLVFHDGFAKKRFAWPNAYATALGGGGGRYGAVLMRIELKEDALIADLQSGTVMTVDSKPVPLEELEAHPQRLAAVYWEAPEFREYVILNETAIAKVSFGTPDALGIFETERKLLNDTAGALTALTGEDEGKMLRAFARTLAFAKAATPMLVKTYAREANEVPPDSLAFTVTPKKDFALGASRARLKNPACAMKKSRDLSYTRDVCMPSDKCRQVGGKCEILLRTLNDTAE